MIGQYTAIGIATSVWTIQKREEISKNLQRIARQVRAMKWSAELDFPVRLVALPELDVLFSMNWQLSEGQNINVRCGCQSIFDAQIHSMKTFGKAKQNYPVWIDRFKKEFDPKALCGCGWPYVIDMVLDGIPAPVITEETRETVKEMAARPWQGNR
jgi:hypothetical protein